MQLKYVRRLLKNMKMKNQIKEDQGIDFDNFSLKEEVEKFKGIEPQGWTVLVRLYTKPKKTKGGLVLPDTVHSEQQYRNCVGLVVKVSKAAYMDVRYEDTGPWCKVGDWVVFPRHAGYKILYKQMPLFVLKEDAIDLVISNIDDIPEISK